MNVQRGILSFISVLSSLGLVAMLIAPALAPSQIDILGPEGSGEFGKTVTVLSNGNIVVCDPYYDDGGTADVGAVYLYDGTSAALISMLTGSTAGDMVGYGGITALENGNYVVSSYYWDNEGVTDAGAVTWGDGMSGVAGEVNAENSLVGSMEYDNVSIGGVTTLSNGNYVVRSQWWNNSTGAVTWGDSMSGITGVVSAENSLVGSMAGDLVGYSGVFALSNGNYVVSSYRWNNFTGAVTWGDGESGITGAVSAENSLVGSTAVDQVGYGGVFELSNGNYVVRSQWWNNNAGAVTWGDGMSGITGAVSADNSLVGSTVDDQVGIGGVAVLSNGNYVVRSQCWYNYTGAVTWGDGASGITGTINDTNSLVGSAAGDLVGYGGVYALSNGNYVVSSYLWDNEVIDAAGAVTWGQGSSGITGVVNADNSLVGSTDTDRVGNGGVFALSNGNYVVSSYLWDSDMSADVGAVTWGDGESGITGPVSADNSLVGSTANDDVSIDGVYALDNGNYVVGSHLWYHSTGAITWGDGMSGIAGVVSADNSLVGSMSGDRVGIGGVTTLSNGNYVTISPEWNNGVITDTGAITWGDGMSGIKGEINDTNSLVGSTASDQVGEGGVYALSNGNFVVSSPLWNDEGVPYAGAVTWGDGMMGTTGEVSVTNSLVGSFTGDKIGSNGVTVLTDGNYVVSSPYWDTDGIEEVGAVTWGDGASGITGTVSADNSLVGSTIIDRVGIGGVTALSNGNYVVSSYLWNNVGAAYAGAVSWGDGTPLSNGPIDADNSVMGKTDGGGEYLNFAYDEVNMQLVVGRPYDNIVTLFRPNRVPVADAGPDQSVLSNASVTLDGSASYDPDGDLPLEFAWEQTSGMLISLSGSDTANPTFTAPMVEGTSTLIFRLVVSDALGLKSLPDEVVITVGLYKALLPTVLK